MSQLFTIRSPIDLPDSINNAGVSKSPDPRTKDGFDIRLIVKGTDLRVGADILVRAALTDEFANASGRYFDNDQGQFSSPHPDALDASKNE